MEALSEKTSEVEPGRSNLGGRTWEVELPPSHEEVGPYSTSENGSCATSVVHITARHVDFEGEQEPLRKCRDNPY